ncbi:MAG: homoserine kinase [bacterium]|nr:homoserine kinase [bacterium]
MVGKTSVEAFAPASMGNVGIGFDILGLAFQQPGDVVRAELLEDGAQPGAVMVAIEGDEGRLSLDAAKNTASVAANAFLKCIGDTHHRIGLTLHKNLPLASGLGSSAASAVAAVVAVNALLGEPLRREDLLPCCMEGEALVSGYHADNVAPSLLGGLVLVAGTTAQDIHPLPIPSNLYFALVTPNVAVPTAEARAVLPKEIPLKAMVSQTVGVARLLHALYRDDVEAMAAAMEQDGVIEPARAHLMPLLNEQRRLAKQTGALGLVISGAGPTLCAVCDQQGVAEQVAAKMEAFYNEAGVGAVSRVTQVDEQGAKVLNQGVISR